LPESLVVKCADPVLVLAPGLALDFIFAADDPEVEFLLEGIPNAIIFINEVQSIAAYNEYHSKK
jgi:hypothetical protein